MLPLPVRPKPNLVAAFLQTLPLSPVFKAAKKLKVNLYWLDLIKAFNIRLQGRVAFVDGLDNEAIKTITPIKRLIERAIINNNSDND